MNSEAVDVRPRNKSDNVGVALVVFGVVLVIASVVATFVDKNETALLAAGVLVCTLGALLRCGWRPKSISANLTRGRFKIEAADSMPAYLSECAKIGEEVVPRSLTDTALLERTQYARKKSEERNLPGEDAPKYSVLGEGAADNLLVRPSAYPTTPMYLLDNAYRILDWNEAFSLAFDRTMEGRKGKSVLEWTYFLDNYQEVLDHGVETFGHSELLPHIDVETVWYTSSRYGEIEAVKRAYQIPDDAGKCLAWLITMELNFKDDETAAKYQEDLLRVLSLDNLWSEYTFSYDQILTSTKLYPELLDTLSGRDGVLDSIPADARILDLGAGTGNLSLSLMQESPARTIFALDNNRTMLDILRTKCRRYVRRDDEGPGLIVVKQDITSLFGLEDEYFDFVIANNVLYALSDPESCLREIVRVLKPGGELRMSGPRFDTDLGVLFSKIEEELAAEKKLEPLRSRFEHVRQINTLRLNPMLKHWTTKAFERVLTGDAVGFAKISHSSDKAYAGQSMLVCATTQLLAEEHRAIA